jgi:hypothetical protein
MTTQVRNGKAFEFAVTNMLQHITGLPVAESDAYQNARTCYHEINDSLRTRFDRAAHLSCNHIIAKESENISRIQPIEIQISADISGQDGDVRDVIITGGAGEIGFSCKTNHDAFKHSRLSGSLDFVNRWGLDPAGSSETYWQRIRPVFDELRTIRTSSGGTAEWRFEEDVPKRFYWPVLDAFEEELLRLTHISSDSASVVSRNLISYIIGTKDFYKIICRPKHVEILGFNLNKTLAVHHTKSPDHVIGIDQLDGGQYSKTIRFNRGFTFNLRIHNASSKIEPSLKFDIRAISLPPSEIYTHHQGF